MKNNYFGKTLFLGFFLFLSFTFQTFGQGDCNDLTSPIELQIGLSAEPSGFFVRSGTQLGRIFRDGIPSNCPSKVYPGIFNAGTTYNWTAVRFWNDDTGSTCITVNFDPNSGAGPCATNGHALVFQEPGGGSTTPYDPTNQGVNFLGDVGASTTQPFSMTVEPGWFEVVFTNTAAVANCSVQFSFAANGGVIMCDMPGGPISDCTLDVPQDFGGEFGPPASITADIPIGDSGILGTNYNLESVEVDITHTWDDDVEIRLQSPTGTILDLSVGNGGSGDNYTGTVFQDGAPSITTGSPPFTGTFQAQGGTFASAYNGEDILGTWTLLVDDSVPAFDDGTLTNFCINFAPILGNPPIISCPMDITVDNDAGVCGAVVNFANAVAIDPDGDLDTVTQTMGPASGSTFPVGDTLIEFTATDMAGNSATCQFTITVNDTEAPNAVCQDITVQLDANGEYVLTPGEIDGGSTDNCNIASLEIGVGTGLEGLFAVYPWTGTGNVARYDYDPVTDAITLVDNPYGSTTLNTNYAMDIDPTSGIVYLLGDSPTTFNRALFTYDLDTASIISEIGDVVSSTGATNPNSMAFGNDGTLYVSFGNGTINTIDPGTLAPAAFATVPNSGGNGMTFDSDNNRIIYSNSFGVIDIYEVTTAGATNFLFSFATVDGGCGGTAQAMEYVGNDKVVASTTFGCSTIYTIDVNTGTANAILSPDGFLNNIKALVYKEANLTTVPDLLLDCSNVGTNNITLVVTDDDGNQSTCEAVVTVEDNIAPVIVCNGEPATITDSVSDSPGVAIPDNTQPGVSVTIDITDDVTITDLDVDLNVSHTWVGDLDMVLTSPAGTSVVIFDRPGVPATTFGCSGDNIDATLDDEAATPVEDECGAGTPTINGTFIPNNPLSAFDGESTLGTWTLTVSDYAAGDTGTINSWGLTYSYEVASTPLQVILDANGMATLDASALLLSVDEACDYTVTVGGGGAPVPGSLATIFGSDNGGSPGGAIYFDLIVGPEDLGITDLDINTPDAGAFTLSVYTTAGSYVGNEGNAGAWTLMATGNGTGAGIDTPSNAVLDAAVPLSAGTSYGIALVLDSGHGHSYTNGTGGNQNYSNADLELQAGAASNVPFDGSPFSPRVFNGNINYVIGDVPSTTIDFDCGDLGLNQIEVTATDASGNTATCTATVEVIDDMDPVLICQDVTIVLDENGMAEINPEDLLATAPSTYEAMVIGSDNQSGTEGFTDFTAPVTDAASISFDWVYTSNDTDPGFDSFGYLLNGVYTQLTNPALGNQSGSAGPINVSPGDVFGFRSQTDDNIFGNNETVVSNFAPGFSGQFEPANWTLNLVNSDGDAFFVEIPGGPLSYDNCGITVLAVDVTDVTCADIGTPIVVTVFASDASGNLASCTSIVTVVDESGPTLECPGDMTVDPGANNLFYELPDYWGEGQATATDNCTDPVTVFSQDPAAGTLVPDGVYTITLCAEDEYGNESCCTFELTVESVLGVDHNSLDSGVAIYPNPAASTVNIANASSILLDRAAIYDVNGKLVQTIDLSNMDRVRPVDVSGLASGVYLVQIQGEGQQTVKRLVKE